VRASWGAGRLRNIAGLSYARGRCPHNPDRPSHTASATEPLEADRGAVSFADYAFLGDRVDVVEKLRAAGTFDCSFCSIIEMRGRNFHTFAFDRVLADIPRPAITERGRSSWWTKHHVERPTVRGPLCRAIIDAGLDDLDYLVQAMTSAIAANGTTLAPLMAAGFRYGLPRDRTSWPDDLRFLRARAKNALRANGKTLGNATTTAIEHLHRHGMYVVGGLNVGNPDDTREAIEAKPRLRPRWGGLPLHPAPHPLSRGRHDQGVPRAGARHQ